MHLRRSLVPRVWCCAHIQSNSILLLCMRIQGQTYISPPKNPDSSDWVDPLFTMVPSPLNGEFCPGSRLRSELASLLSTTNGLPLSVKEVAGEKEEGVN